MVAVSLTLSIVNSNESINGLITVRAFEAVPAFITKSSLTVDDYTRAEMSQACAPQWLGIRISALAACSMFLTSLGIVLQPSRLDPGLVGLVLTYANMVNATLQGFLRQATEVEIRMNGVERVRYFSSEVTKEAPYEKESEGRRLSSSEWPSRGEVSFVNVAAKYRPELPRVVDGLSIEVAASEKVGICGRTGSGKSTLMLLLFRILELTEGSITIDGVDIKTLGLSALRRGIAMLPQDPTLFSGSIRENL